MTYIHKQTAAVWQLTEYMKKIEPGHAAWSQYAVHWLQEIVWLWLPDRSAREETVRGQWHQLLIYWTVMSYGRSMELTIVTMETTVFWDVTPCSQQKFTNVSEEHDASVTFIICSGWSHNGCHLYGEHLCQENWNTVFCENSLSTLHS